MPRETLSKKMRFDTFKRDGFQCQYCGSSPPSVVLEVDHIHPVSKGGKNHVDNLITSCFDCNRGKSAGLLTVAPLTVSDKAKVMAEKLAQLKAFERLQKAKRRTEDVSIDSIEHTFSSYFLGFTFTDAFRESVRMFLQRMTVYEVLDAMNLACKRMDNEESTIKYFCGICWRITREKENG